MIQTIGPIAVVQYEPNDTDVWKNLETVRSLSSEAALRGANLVVFPELCLGPNSFDDKSHAADFSQEKGGYQTRFVNNISNAIGVTIVFGYVEFGDDGEFYNSAAIVSPNRGLLGNVRKHNLHSTDYVWASPSYDIFPNVVFENCRVGIMIGSDVRNVYDDSTAFVQSPRQRFYERGSVDLVCVLDGTRRPTTEFPCDEWINLSKTLCTNVAACNRIGFDGSGMSGGGSCVIDRDTRIWSKGSNFNSVAIVGGALS